MLQTTQNEDNEVVARHGALCLGVVHQKLFKPRTRNGHPIDPCPTLNGAPKIPRCEARHFWPPYTQSLQGEDDVTAVAVA